MTGRTKHYYVCGNTAKGFYSIMDSTLLGLERVFVLTGHLGKPDLIKEIAEEATDRGCCVEYLHSPADNESLDGIIVRDLKFGIINGTAPRIVQAQAPGVIEEYVCLDSVWDKQRLAKQKNTILQLTQAISASYQQAYGLFAEALRIHDEWEAIYIRHMDFDAANQISLDLIDLFFGGLSLSKDAAVLHRYLGAATHSGAVDYIPSLTADIAKRYLIKGRPGSGKSTMLKNLAKSAQDKGFDTEVYHCGFDPNSLDMIILPELGIAVFDSTAPHEYFPERESDEIIDMYEQVIHPGTDEQYADELPEIKTRYSAKMKDATGFLAKAKQLQDELDVIYREATVAERLTAIKQAILLEIDRLHNAQTVIK